MQHKLALNIEANNKPKTVRLCAETTIYIFYDSMPCLLCILCNSLAKQNISITNCQLRFALAELGAAAVALAVALAVAVAVGSMAQLEVYEKCSTDN